MRTINECRAHGSMDFTCSLIVGAALIGVPTFILISQSLGNVDDHWFVYTICILPCILGGFLIIRALLFIVGQCFVHEENVVRDIQIATIDVHSPEFQNSVDMVIASMQAELDILERRDADAPPSYNDALHHERYVSK